MIKSKIYNTCLEEYKIVQSKIDKIGEFKFKVRGWSFTFQSAALAGLFTHNISTFAAVTFFSALGMGVFFFNYIEQEQLVLVDALSKRGAILEKTLSRLSLPSNIEDENTFIRLLTNELGGTPRIGVALRNESRQGKLHILGNMLKHNTNMFFIFQYIIYLLSIIAYVIYIKYGYNISKVLPVTLIYWT